MAQQLAGKVETDLRIIAENVKRERLARGLSQDALSQAANVRIATISELETNTGSKGIQLETISKIAAGLEIETAVLLIAPKKHRSAR